MIRFGTVGTGKITDEFITSGKTHEDFKLSAVYSRDKEKGEAFRKKHEGDYLFTSLEEMAQSDLIDAVYIASPNSLHAEQAIHFMNHKKHVLCEKPVASNTKELKEMIEASRANGILLMEAMKNTFLPNFKAIGDNLHKIGKVRRFFSSFCQYSSRYDTYKRGEHTNTFDPSFSNGSLMDIGIYCLYPLVYYFGVPSEIRANATILGSGVDGNGSILLKYEDMDGVIMHSKISDSKLLSEIQGEKGNIIIDRINLPSSVNIVYRNGDVEDITRPQFADTMSYEIREFMNLIKQGKTESPVNTHRLSLEVHEIIEEARRQIGLEFPADRK